VISALVVLVAPLVLGLMGVRQRRREPTQESRGAWDWRLTISSTLLSALAFNLVFFVQELFLVVPKALTPGLHPTLYHNNHHWTGDNPLTSSRRFAVVAERRSPHAPSRSFRSCSRAASSPAFWSSPTRRCGSATWR
jgi:hypothetical protein